TLNSKRVDACSNNEVNVVDLYSMKVTIDTAEKSISFAVSGKANQVVESGKVKLSFSLFDKDLFNMDLDVCKLAADKGGCPLKQAPFSNSVTTPIPGEIPDVADILARVPGVDLNVAVRLENADGNPLGCYAVGLANDVSVYTRGTEAGTVVVASAAAGGAFLASLGSFIGTAGGAAAGSALSQARPTTTTPNFGDVIGTFQFLATTGMLSLNYPRVYHEFTCNFGWSMGAIRLGPIEKALESFRGNDNVSRESGKLLRRLDLLPNANATNYSQLSGIENYAAKLKIDPKNYFMTVLIIYMIVMAALTGACLLFRLILEILSKYKPKLFTNLRNHFALYYVGNLLRVFVLCYFFLATAAIYQFTQNDIWPITLLAAIVLGLFCIALISFVTFRVIRNGADKLYSFPNLQYKYGSLYIDYRPSVYTFFIVVLVAAVIRAIAVGLLSKNVWAQMSILIVTEIMFFFALFFFRPYASKASNGLMIFVSVMRVINTGLLFAFIESVFISELARAIIGYALVITQALIIAAIVIFTLWSLFITIRKFVQQHKQSKQELSRSDSNRSS
ncbi:TRP-domain-containing protein, partial [Neoconidiobolus thromboides FSU 785]